MKAIVKFQGTVDLDGNSDGGFWHIGMQDEDNPRFIYTSLSGSDPILRRRFCGETGKEDAQKFADKINNGEELTEEDLYSWLDGWGEPDEPEEPSPYAEEPWYQIVVQTNEDSEKNLEDLPYDPEDSDMRF